MLELILVIISGLTIAQFFVILKLFRSLKTTNRLLTEVRLIFRRAGIYFEPVKKKYIAERSCQFCKYRVTYIQITDDPGSDAFYYRCRKRNLDIRLGDTCDAFERDLS
jgi:hypothetical protein